MFFIGSVSADSPVLPNVHDCDLSMIPPSATKMLKQERVDREDQAMSSIKKIVHDVVASERKNNKRHKKSQPVLKNNATQKNRVVEKALSKILENSALAQEMSDIIDKQFHDPELQNKHISLTVKQIPTRDALILIAKNSGLQLVVDADVTGVIQELNLDNIPLSAALHSVLMSNDPKLAIIKSFGVWRVLKMQAARDFFSSLASRERDKDIVVSCKTLVYAKWNDALKIRIEKLWQGITQPDGQKNSSYLVFDDVNKKLYYKAHQYQVEEFEAHLGQIDMKIPQIRIDARVVMATKNFEDSLGFNWSGVYNRRAAIKHFDFVGLGPVNKETGNGTDATTEYNDIAGWALNLIPTSFEKLGIRVPFIFGNKDMNTKRLSLELNAAENRNEIRTILKPSLLVFNDESAEILVGQEMPHEVRLDETIESRLTNITTVNYKDVGMKIRVKPIVVPDQNGVFLDVYVENSMVTKPAFPIIQGSSFVNEVGERRATFNYTIKTSRSQNRVLLKSGQTTMIGGLMTNSRGSDVHGVPGIQDIPVLGWLFKGSKKHRIDDQLLIFITPTLVHV